jgi:hypothetical protein
MLGVNQLIGFGSGVAAAASNASSEEANWETTVGDPQDFTFTGGDIIHATAQGSSSMYTGGTTPIVLVGNFTVDAIIGAEANSWSWGIFPTSESGSFADDSSANGNMDGMSVSYRWNGEAVYYAPNVNKGSTSGLAANNVMRMQRTGLNDIEFLLDTGSGFASFHDFTETSSADMYVCFGSNNNITLEDVTYSWNE